MCSIKKTSTDQISERAKREIAVLKKKPDSEVDFSDIPLQDPDDSKWKTAVVGKFYRPSKQPIAMRLDADRAMVENNS